MSRKRLDPDSLPAIAARLVALRRVKAPTQAEFARIIDVPKNTWNTYETASGRINIDTAMKLYRIWGVDPSWIYLGIQSNMPGDLMNLIRNELRKNDKDNDNGEDDGRRNGTRHT